MNTFGWSWWIQQTNRKGDTALDLARRKGLEEAAKMLEESMHTKLRKTRSGAIISLLLLDRSRS